MCDWLPLANFIVQICLFAGLVWYTLETRKIRKASQRSADAATDAARASVQQALAAQETLHLLKESYEERIGQGPQIVREAIQRAKSLIGYWKYEATHIAQPPQGNPDPAPLANSGLLDVLSHARQISPECATLLIEANAAGPYSGRYVGMKFGGGLVTNPEVLKNPPLNLPDMAYGAWVQERAATRFFE